MKKNFQAKLFTVYFTVIFLILVFMAILVLMISFRYYYESAVDSQTQFVEKTSQQIDSQIQQMDKLACGLLFNRSFMDIIKNETLQEERYNECNKEILTMITSLDAPLLSTYRVMIFTPKHYYTFVKSREDKTYISEALNHYVYQSLLDEAGGARILVPTHYDSFSRDAVPVFSVMRNITDYTGKKYGGIEIQNLYDDLDHICSADPDTGEAVVYDQNGDLVYPFPLEDNKDRSFYKKLYRTLESCESPFGSRRFERLQLSYYRSDYSGFTTVIFQPLNRIVPFTGSIFLAVLCTFLFLGLSSLVLIRILSKRMTRPLVELNRSIQNVNLNNLTLSLSASYDISEIDQINASFQTMFEKLKESIAQSVESRANEERANYLALQSQMNPHTIYNTITMIESISYMHGDKEIAELCVYFSRMLRYISDYTRHSYTVKDETSHLENYVNLMKKRHEGLLNVSINVDSPLYEKELPKFTLQPLVENSIKHGFYDAEQVLTVSVDIHEYEEGWYIQICDDGLGIPEDKIQEIYRQFEHCDRALKDNNEVINMKIGNLALNNIYVRLRILYREAFLLTLKNSENGGLCVTILIRENTVNCYESTAMEEKYD